MGGYDKTDLNVFLSLLFSKCIPILMNCLEAVNLTPKDISSLAYVYNSVFFKLFHTFDKNTIENCQFHCGYLPFRYNFALRKLNFLKDIHDGPDTTVKY
jgi:hypothetical protein